MSHKWNNCVHKSRLGVMTNYCVISRAIITQTVCLTLPQENDHDYLGIDVHKLYSNEKLSGIVVSGRPRNFNKSMQQLMTLQKVVQ